MVLHWNSFVQGKRLEFSGFLLSFSRHSGTLWVFNFQFQYNFQHAPIASLEGWHFPQTRFKEEKKQKKPRNPKTQRKIKVSFTQCVKECHPPCQSDDILLRHSFLFEWKSGETILRVTHVTDESRCEYCNLLKMLVSYYMIWSETSEFSFCACSKRNSRRSEWNFFWNMQPARKKTLSV